MPPVPLHLIWNPIHGPATPIFSWDYRQGASVCSNPSLCHSRPDVDSIIIFSIFQSDVAVRFICKVGRTQIYRPWKNKKLQSNSVLFPFLLWRGVRGNCSATLLSFREEVVSCVSWSHSMSFSPDVQHPQLWRSMFWDKKRGEGSPCLWPWLQCTYMWPKGRWADAASPSLCISRIITTHGRGNKGSAEAIREERRIVNTDVYNLRRHS